MRIIIPLLILFSSISPVFAHSFNVAILLQDKQFLNGFILAASERDSHADETADGHLGGLDVFISTVDTPAEITDDTDIVVLRENMQTLTAILLYLGQTPFTQSGQPRVKRFISAYKTAYGMIPTATAAQGYNAAQRIDRALRPWDGVENRAAILRSFEETTRNFSW
jgi:hypothetical protein